jgi:hypothetical protein
VYNPFSRHPRKGIDSYKRMPPGKKRIKDKPLGLGLETFKIASGGE